LSGYTVPNYMVKATAAHFKAHFSPHGR